MPLVHRKIFLHFSTRDVPRARAFYTGLGFTVNEPFREHWLAEAPSSRKRKITASCISTASLIRMDMVGI